MELTEENEIKELWDLLYPYAKFNYDYSVACVGIIKELKNLCKPQFKAILAVIYRAIIKEIVPENVDQKELCQKLENHTDKLCLKFPEYTIYRQSGAVPREKPIGPNICNSLRTMLIFRYIMQFTDHFPVSFFFYNISLPEQLSQGPYYPFRLKGLLSDRMSTNQYNNTIRYFGGENSDSNVFRGYINFDLTDSKEVEYYIENFVKVNYESMVARWRDEMPKVNQSLIAMTIYLHQGFRTGALDLNIKWDDLCKSDYVKNFKL